METVTTRRSSMVVSLNELRRTPLDRIPAEQAADVARQIMSRLESGLGTVDVARFGSAV